MNATVRTSSSAIVSLVFGVLGWFALPLVGAIVAVITGHAARAEIRRAPPGTLDGDGLALVGLLLGWANLAFLLLVTLGIFLLFGGLAFLAKIAGTH
ncbi:MAG TPA: DUF4190 domain-containing protein [Rhodanobacteraceae bacterium]|nr:DUF4190 domain-containing protein [Rhodanobacteraceae bacterium]